MAEYIEREAALNVCEMHYQHYLMMHDCCGDTTADNIKTDIKTLPAADVVEVRHGEWKFRKNWDYFVCSECSFEHTNYSHYCPNCGAKMDGEGEGGWNGLL